MGKSGVSTPSLLQRTLQRFGVGELYEVFINLKQAEDYNQNAADYISEASAQKKEILQAQIETHGQGTSAIRSENQDLGDYFSKRACLTNHGTLIVQSPSISNPEDWISAIHIISKNINNPNDLIYGLENSQIFTKENFTKETQIKMSNPIDAALQANAPSIINLKTPSGNASISCYTNDQAIMLFLMPQAKTFLFSSSDKENAKQFYKDLMTQMKAEVVSVTQIKFPDSAALKQATAVQDTTPTDKRSGGLHAQDELAKKGATRTPSATSSLTTESKPQETPKPTKSHK